MRRERISLALLVFLKTFCIHFTLGDQTTRFLWFKTQPCDATAGEKLNALFYCEARSIVSSPISYTWLVNDTELSSLPYQKYTLQGLHGNLLVTGLKRHVDEAKFRCVATNGYGSIVSVVATLKVAYFEAMDSTTQVNLTKQINFSFTIPSPRTRSYPPASVTWQRLSDSLILSDGFSNGKMFISGNGDLSFVGIQDRQADTYRVTLSNPYVGKSFTQDFKITISGKLLSTSGQPFLKPIGNVTFEEGTPKVKLECIVEYDVKNGNVRPPYITWYKDGTVLNVKLSSKYEFIQGSQLKLIVKNIQLSDQGEYKCVATSWTSVATSTGPQRGTKRTFVPTDGEVTGDTISPKRSEDEADNGMFIWVYVGAGVVAILIFILVTLCIVRAKQAKLKRRRSVTLKMDNNQYEELEMNRRNGSSRANGVPGGRKTSSKGDKNHLLNETSDDGLYAPVRALHNMSTRSGACRGSVDVKRAQNNQGHEYEEPIKKTPRKPYSAPLPSIPTGPRIEPRPPSFHSYLELLGPDEQTGDLYAEAREGAFNLGFREPNDDVYNSACDGRVTETFRALSGLNLPNPGNEDSSQGIGGATPNRDSGVGTLNRGSRVIPLCDTACSEPLYHELEGPEIEPEGIYEYDVAEERINLRPESLYQPLLVEGRNSVAVVLGNSDIYEPLDKKERSASAPSAVVLRRAKPRRQDSMEAKRNCDEKRLSRALTDPQNLSGGCENENLYQPLNNSLDRCPLNVSKPKSSTGPSGEGKRLSNASVCHRSPTPSHRSLKESDLHAVSVSPSGSLKEGTSATPSPSRGKSGSTKSARGHSRQNSDTHGIVTIEKPRRASTTDDLTRYQAMPRFHRRNLSDAGLCAVDLSQLHVDIDVSTISTNQSSPDDGLYMPLVKTAFNAGVRDSIYAELDEDRRERSCETEPNRESIYHSLQDQRDSIYQDIVR
ncbi:predicted protein [Nematostella vectensis]|uniref:Ig-like domain-containing protein n=1 Tax=Nematostella vectensis TaxID=45351 RepID=A7SE48_NEMVE|nr:predicted protein [Nematostella vectensis]|eukprot:XP_001630109.1 predicted protein [Nematostella vectensis]